jgi:sec-independent protein translocase protein TatC
MAAALATIRPEAPKKPDGPLLGGMSFLEHLDELRKRIVLALAGVAVGMLVAFFYIDRIFNFVFEPARRLLPPGTSLIYTQPGEAFSLYIDIALIAGAILAAPFVFLQVWLFIAPALYSREKRYVIPFVLLTTAGSVAGAAFSHYLLFPSMIRFFGLFSSPDLRFMPRVSDVFDLYLRMLAGMVAVFQIPTFVYFLARMGLVTAGWLWRNFRYAILIIFIAAAVLTPSSDPWNQFVFAAPMMGLYLLSIAIAWIVSPRRKPLRYNS